jgi:hypothetical protein
MFEHVIYTTKVPYLCLNPVLVSFFITVTKYLTETMQGTKDICCLWFQSITVRRRDGAAYIMVERKQSRAALKEPGKDMLSKATL